MLPTNTWIAEQPIAQKKALIYALGGGYGHIQRAMLIAQQFSSATIMYQKESPYSSCIPVIHPRGEPLVSWSIQTLNVCAASHDCVIVDTFPQGIAHELTQEMLQHYCASILIARYLREEVYHDYEIACGWYTHVWIPYSQEKCEWNHPPNGVYTGTIVRPISIDNERIDLCIIGDRNVIPKRWFSLFPERTMFVHHRFHVLPNAQKYLCVGAGYNLFWELNSLGRSVAHIPLEKRYDDQFQRAMRFGRMVSTFEQLFTFLEDCS